MSNGPEANGAAVEPVMRGRGGGAPPPPAARRAGWWRWLGAIAGSTLVIWFFSEVFFVNVGDFFYAWSQRDGVAQALLVTAEAVGVWLLFYAFFVLWLLAAVVFFRVRSAWRAKGRGLASSPAATPDASWEDDGWRRLASTTEARPGTRNGSRRGSRRSSAT